MIESAGSRADGSPATFRQLAPPTRRMQQLRRRLRLRLLPRRPRRRLEAAGAGLGRSRCKSAAKSESLIGHRQRRRFIINHIVFVPWRQPALRSLRPVCLSGREPDERQETEGRARPAADFGGRDRRPARTNGIEFGPSSSSSSLSALVGGPRRPSNSGSSSGSLLFAGSSEAINVVAPFGRAAAELRPRRK